MQVELNAQEIETLLTSLKYSKLYVSGAEGTPPAVRQENLARIEAAEAKLRAARKDSKKA